MTYKKALKLNKSTIQYVKDLGFKVLSSVGDNIISLGINPVSMILVERHYGYHGLGIFSYFISVYYSAVFICQFGIPQSLENYLVLAQKNDMVDRLLANCKKNVWFTSVIGFIFCIGHAFFDLSVTTIDENSIGSFILH